MCDSRWNVVQQLAALQPVQMLRMALEDPEMLRLLDTRSARDGHTLLHLAIAWSGKESTAAAKTELLLSKRASPSRRDRNRMTPLAYAATHGYSQVCRQLLQA